MEYSPYLVVGRVELPQRTALRAGLCGVNLKGCLSLFLGEGPDKVHHELFFTDGLYVSLLAFDEGTEFTLAPLDEGANFAFYVPWWLSLGYGAGFGL